MTSLNTFKATYHYNKSSFVRKIVFICSKYIPIYTHAYTCNFKIDLR